MEKIRLEDLLKTKIKRKENATKHDFGSVLIIAGSRLYSGAAVLTALGCLYSGPGLVFLAVPENVRRLIRSSIPPEVIYYPSKSRDFFSLEDINIASFIKKRRISVVAIGPGIGVENKTKEFFREVINTIDTTLVIDADGLNIIAELGLTKKNSIITPHEYEAARILRIPKENISKNRVMYAKELAKNFGVCVLKGHRTVVTDGRRCFINKTGNPGMAKGGSGDVLTGMIAAMIPQIKDLFLASCLAVYIHGLAGDIGSRILTEVSNTPSYFLKLIPLALKKSGIIYNG